MREEHIPLTRPFNATPAQAWIFGINGLVFLFNAYYLSKSAVRMGHFFLGMACAYLAIFAFMLIFNRDPLKMPHLHISSAGIRIRSFYLLPAKTYAWEDIAAVHTDWATLSLDLVNGKHARLLRIDEFERMRHLRAFLREATAEKNVPFHDITAAYPKNFQAHSLD